MVALLLRDQAVASLSQAETKVPAIIICNVILIVASTLGIIVRIFVRVRYIQFGLDDWFCAIGWVCLYFSGTTAIDDRCYLYLHSL